MYRLVKIIFLLALISLGLSFYFIKQPPPKNDFLSDLQQSPLQAPTDKQEFSIEKNGITYNLKPMYDYEFYGTIVSFYNTSTWLDDFYKRAGDFINIKDICVIWGDNINSKVYKSLKFSNGTYKCFIEGRSEDASKFKNNSLSNNHLLSDNEEINKKIISAGKWDQIYLKGYLVSYSKKGESFVRTSSITRDDVEDGACEVIYVTDFKILKKSNTFWQEIFTLSKYSSITSFILMVILFWGIISKENAEFQKFENNRPKDF